MASQRPWTPGSLIRICFEADGMLIEHDVERWQAEMLRQALDKALGDKPRPLSDAARADRDRVVGA